MITRAGARRAASGLKVAMNASRAPRRLRRLTTARVLDRSVPVARSPLARTLGLALLDRDRAGAGLLIPRCRGVHTFGMRFALDLVFLDTELRPLAVRPAVPPWRFAALPGARAVLELPAGEGR